MDLNIYRIFYPNTKEYRFYSETHGSLFKVARIMGHKRNFYKFRITESTQCILSDHNALKLEIHIKQISGKYTKSWRFNNSSQNDE